MNYNSLIQNIKSLPPLSDVAIKIQRLYIKDNRNIDIVQLTRIIESDALLTVNILRMTNSSFYGFSKKITSIMQAVTLFGAQVIYGFVMSYFISEKLKANIGAYNVSNVQFNDICHLQSSLMMQWYSKIDLKHAQFLSSLALIMETGKLVMAREVVNSSYIKEFKTGLLTAQSVEKYEHRTVGTTSYYLSGLLFKHWNLDPLYVKILMGLDYEDKNIEAIEHFIDIVDVIRTAINVKNILSKESIECASDIVDEIGYDAKTFEEVAYNMHKKYYKKYT